MDTLSAFIIGRVCRNNKMKVFDWDKAVRLIKQHGIKNASAGLSEDWEWTAGEILHDGKPSYDTSTYLSSTWATPILHDDDARISYECYIMEDKTEYCEVNDALNHLEGA